MEPSLRHRKVRKGTHSCWECKRRKMKCTMEPRHGGQVCSGCRKRGSSCIGQEFPEGPSDVPWGTMSPGAATDASSGCRPPLESVLLQHSTPPGCRLEQLARFLHDALPSPDETATICGDVSSGQSFLAHEVLAVPYAQLERDGVRQAASLVTERPGPEQHPVLIARHMLRLAVWMQQQQQQQTLGPRADGDDGADVGARLADVATRLVTTNDDLVGSVEGVECVLLEGLYQLRRGSLRRGWVSVRRAMTVAQLMGLHRGRSEAPAGAGFTVSDDAAAAATRRDPAVLWFRIVDLDCHLCLLLGLPPGCTTPADRDALASPAVLAAEPPLGRLERLHCAIASRVLERNEAARARQPAPGSPAAPSAHLAATLALDADINRAARGMPARWWLPPNLLRCCAAGDAQALFWDMRRLLVQVCHFNLLNLVHLPYMLRRAPSSAVASSPPSGFSLMTCVTASREVLVRFLALRSVARLAYTCRTVDFVALMAALTLLLAHMHSQASCPSLAATPSAASSTSPPASTPPASVLAPTETSLAHQYLSDRAMVEQVQESIDQLGATSLDDPLVAKSAALLRQLLAIDLMAGADGDGTVARAQRRHVSILDPAAGDGESESDSSTSDEPAVCVVHIPYFGTIRIDREGPAGSALSQHYAELGCVDPLWTAGIDDWPFQSDMAFLRAGD